MAYSLQMGRIRRGIRDGDEQGNFDIGMEGFLTVTGWEVLAPREQIAQSVDHMRLNYQYNGSFRWQEVSKFDPLEDFANSFAMYYNDASGLKAQSAERYGWMAANLPK